MTRLGVTGGIGCGKSYVCRLMTEQFLVPVYNCDIRAHLVTHTNADVIKQLTALMPGLYDEAGELDKRRMAAYLFASEEHAAKINAIIHPAVREDLHKWYRHHADEPVVAVESAILYESGFETEVDRVLYVDAPLETRIRRVIARDGLSRDEVLQRMQSQRSDEARRRADYTILNDDGSDLVTQLCPILRLLK